MDKSIFKFESMPLLELARSPAGTEACYLVDWENSQKALNKIAGRLSRSSLAVKDRGAVTLKSYHVIDPVSGEASKLILATVVKPIVECRRRGRKKKTTTSKKSTAVRAKIKLWPLY